MNRNNLRLIAYSTGTTPAYNTGLEWAQDVMFSKVYPGGMCTGMTFYVPRDVTAEWVVKLGMRIAAWNGLKMVWEGYVSNLTPTVTASGAGVSVTCEGAWSKYLQRRNTLKRWADTDISFQNMVKQDDVTTEDFWEIENNFGHLEIFPKEVAFSSGDYLAIRYTMPTGQTIKRITYDYEFAEETQQWEMLIWDVTGAGAVTGSSVTATGTGSHDLTLATPRQAVEFRMYARGNQTATYAKKVYSEWDNLVIYGETGSINAQEITKDIRSYVSELSTDETQIGALTLSLVPFLAKGETYAEVLTRAAGYGDASYNSWAVYVGMSDGVSDNLPRLVLEQVPALTAYDYAIRMDTPEVASDLSFTQSLDEVYNWIALHYTDASGFEVWRTPDDDANLTNAASVAAYGRRDIVLEVPTTSQTDATNYGLRYLAAHKDPQWIANGQISIMGSVRGMNGLSIPACEVQPGKRIKLENWLNDLSGNGLTLLITGTDYDDANEIVTLDFGKPTTEDVFVLRLQREMEAKR